jgi:hypothetical protein
MGLSLAERVVAAAEAAARPQERAAVPEAAVPERAAWLVTVEVVPAASLVPVA